MAADLSTLSTEDLIALKGGDLSKVSTAGLQALKGLQSGPPAAERVATDPISTGARATAGATPAELLAGSSPGRFLLEPARGLLELGSHLGLPGGESAQQTGELIKRGREAYGDKGMDIAGIAGQVASPAVLKVGKLVPAGASLLQKSLGSGVTGMTAGALTPTEDKGDFWKEKGMQTGTGLVGGAALPSAGALTKGVFGAAYKSLEPILPAWLTVNPGSGPEAIWNRFKDKLAGPAKEKIVEALMQARELVPGSSPTVGEAIAHLPGGSPIASLQQQLGATRVVSPGMIARGQEQEAARAAALGTVAKTPADLAAAETARAAEAATNYGKAFAETTRADPTLAKLAEDPYFKKALPDALDLAASKGITPSTKVGIGKPVRTPDWDKTDPTTRALSYNGATGKYSYTGDIFDKGGYLKTVRTEAEPGAAISQGSPIENNLTQFLHYVKTGLDKQLSRTGDTALAATEKEAVQSVKAKLNAWMDEKNPAYGYARRRFADLSKPINEMQVGQGLQEKLNTALGEASGGHIERAAAYTSALRSPEALIKSKAGGPVRTLEQILSPEQLGAVNAVGSDLGRKAQFERLARGTRLNEVPGTVESPIPNLWSRPASITNYIARKVFGHDLQNKIGEIAGPQLLDPKAFAASLMDKPISVRKKLVDEFLQRAGYPIVSGAPAAAVGSQY